MISPLPCQCDRVTVCGHLRPDIKSQNSSASSPQLSSALQLYDLNAPTHSKDFPTLQSADQICMNHEPVSLSVASLTITLLTIVAQSPVFNEQKIDNLSIMCMSS